MNRFPLKVVTPAGVVLEKEVAGLYLRGCEGDLAVFAGHIPFVTAVKECKCTVVYGEDGENGEDTEAEVGEGLLNVEAGGVTLLIQSWKA